MNKPVPTPTFENIRPPNKNYVYFEDIQNHPFLPLANTFELVNAGWLADLAMLAYFNRADIQDRLGLTGFNLEFFSRDTTQYFVVHNQDIVVVSIAAQTSITLGRL